MLSFDNLKPFVSSFGSFFGQPVVEKGFDSSLFAVVVIRIIWDETNEAT
jgi:hypothetical protein